MKPITIIAIILITIGIVVFAYQGITYTTREKVVDLGPIQVTSETTKTLPLPRSWEGSRSWAALCCWSWGIKRGEQRQTCTSDAGDYCSKWKF